MADKNISIVFENANNAPTYGVTGAFGGGTPDSQNVVASFYVETQSMPNSINLPVEEDGSVNMNQPGDRITRGDVTREIQCKMVLSPVAAITIGEWLMRHGNETLNRLNNK